MDKSKTSEKKPQTRGGFQNRGRGQQNNKKDGNNRPQRPLVKRPPRIIIKTPIEQIKLNEAQAEKIKEYDEKLRQLNPCTAPSEQDYNKKMADLEKKVNQVKGSIDTYHAMIAEEDRKRDQYLKANTGVDLNSLKGLSQDVKDLFERRKQIEADLEATKDKLKKLQSNVAEVQNKAGLKNSDDAQRKIDEIDNKIEVGTLSGAQLKKLMSERERLLKSSEELEKLGGSIKEMEELKKKRNQLLDEKKKINEDIDQMIQKRNTARTQFDSLKGETKKFKDQKDTFYGKIRELIQQQKALREEENKTRKEYYDNVEQYRKKLQEITELEFQKKVIYREAERIMLQIEEGQKKIGEIQERVNPHQKQIDTAKSLIVYLEEIQIKDKEETKVVVKTSKGNNKETMALINSLRKPQKGKQQRAKKNVVSLTHSLDAMAQFATVDVQAPKKASEIPEIVEMLKQKVSAWESEFVKATVNFAISEDGKVKVTVSLS